MKNGKKCFRKKDSLGKQGKNVSEKEWFVENYEWVRWCDEAMVILSRSIEEEKEGGMCPTPNTIRNYAVSNIAM